jgi:hypothetical protein
VGGVCVIEEPFWSEAEEEQMALHAQKIQAVELTPREKLIQQAVGDNARIAAAARKKLNEIDEAEKVGSTTSSNTHCMMCEDVLKTDDEKEAAICNDCMLQSYAGNYPEAAKNKKHWWAQ